MPAAGQHLWDWFAALSAARGSSGYGPSPIGFEGIAAWSRLTGNDPTPWEVETLRAMDDAALKVWAEKAKR